MGIKLRGLEEIDSIIVHCSDTRPNWLPNKSNLYRLAEINKWHGVERKFAAVPVEEGGNPNHANVGYHFAIGRNGEVIECRPLHVVGAHCRGHNLRSIGICLFGGYASEAGDQFEAHFTPEQNTALRKLIAALRRDHGIPRHRVFGHNDFAARACPGFKVARWYEGKPSARPLARTNTMIASGAGFASAAGAAGSLIAPLGALGDSAQLAAIALIGIAALAFLWIGRERLKKYQRGDV